MDKKLLAIIKYHIIIGSYYNFQRISDVAKVLKDKYEKKYYFTEGDVYDVANSIYDDWINTLDKNLLLDKLKEDYEKAML